MKLENKVQKYLNMLYDGGVRNVSGEPDGMSIYDEETLTKLLIQASIPDRMPEIHLIFDKTEFLDRVALTIDSTDPMAAIEFSDHVINNVVKHYRPIIKKLLEETHARSQPDT